MNNNLVGRKSLSKYIRVIMLCADLGIALYNIFVYLCKLSYTVCTVNL